MQEKILVNLFLKFKYKQFTVYMYSQATFKTKVRRKWKRF